VSRTSLTITPALHSYLVAHGTPPDEVLRDLAEETAALGDVADMQIAPEQGAFMTMLTRLLGARRAVEIGTFTGYSALCVARGLPDDGTLLACDVSEDWTSVARKAWERAGVDHKIDLHVAPALETLGHLPEEPAFDLAFVDADKTGYPAYYAALLPRMRQGGVLLFDNVLAGGRVVDEAEQGDNVRAIRETNDMIAADDRVEVVMLPLADGLTMARKR
jgi:caffeoyl-CoA O-methyltransferase